MPSLYDDDGIDGPFERAMSAPLGVRKVKLTKAQQWAKLQAEHKAARELAWSLDNQGQSKYGERHWTLFGSTKERHALDAARKRQDRASERIFKMLEQAERDWKHGVPACWVCEDLSYEDAFRSKGEALSVEPPKAYGF